MVEGSETVSEWKSVKLLESTYLKILELKGNKGFDSFINDAVNKYRRENEEITKLKLEIERLKSVGASQPLVALGSPLITFKAEDAPAPQDLAVPGAPIPLGASQNLPTASTSTLENTRPGSNSTTKTGKTENSSRRDYWMEEQEERFNFKLDQVARLCRMKEEHQRRMEEIKGEGVRQRRFKVNRDQFSGEQRVNYDNSPYGNHFDYTQN